MFKIILSRIRELQGDKSVSAFARYLEMPQKTVDTYVNGERKPSVEFIMRICSKCHVSADWLLGLSDRRDGSETAAPAVELTKTRQSRPDATLSFELAAIRRQLEHQQREIAALKELNKQPAACCG